MLSIGVLLAYKEVRSVLENQELSQSEALTRLQMWMETYGNDVIHLAYSYVQNYHQAEDLAQDVFLRAFTKMDTFKGQSSVKTWLLSITANRCKDYLRSWSKKHEIHDETHFEFTVASHDTAQEVADKLANDTLWKCVHQLPIKYREVVVLYYQRELTGQEIAETLGMTEQSVRTRLHRARTLLKENISKGGIVE